jgi:type 1 glutamine amidotransferase
MKKKTRRLRSAVACLAGLAIVFAVVGAQAGQLSKVLCVEMCGTNGSGGACHPSQQVSGDVMMKALGTKYGFQVDVSKDAAQFTDAGLKPYDVLVFDNVGNNPFTSAQMAAFQKYMWNGGGYVGWHASDATHYTWPWYVDSFMCADINGHGGVTGLPIKLDSIYKTHPCNTGMFDAIGPDRALVDTNMADEWYYWLPDPMKNPNVKPLAWVYENNAKRPIAWCQEFCKCPGQRPGRMWYSNCGQSNSTGGNNFYTNSWFMQSVVNALRWTAHMHAPGDHDANFTLAPYQCPTATSSICVPVSVSPEQGINLHQQEKANLEDVFAQVKAGKAFLCVYSISGKKISAGTFTNYKDLKNSLPSGCNIIRISDLSGNIIRQLAIAQ